MALISLRRSYFPAQENGTPNVYNGGALAEGAFSLSTMKTTPTAVATRAAGISFALILLLLASFRWRAGSAAAAAQVHPDTLTSKADKTVLLPADAATIMARRQVPILCYHQIRQWRATDSKKAKDYIVPEDAFRAQMKMLADSGFQTILPDELCDYLVYGKPLPPKPVMITFDDTDLEQFTVGLPELEKYHFKAVFFIMTVSIGRPQYMTREDIRLLSERGHVLGSHTWDHHNVKQYAGNDWVKQVDKPTAELQEITGKPIRYFAYPFGLWNETALPELKKRGFAAAFQLSARRDDHEPLYTIRRMIVPGSWTPAAVHAWMKHNFK